MSKPRFQLGTTAEDAIPDVGDEIPYDDTLLLDQLGRQDFDIFAEHTKHRRDRTPWVREATILGPGVLMRLYYAAQPDAMAFEKWVGMLGIQCENGDVMATYIVPGSRVIESDEWFRGGIYAEWKNTAKGRKFLCHIRFIVGVRWPGDSHEAIMFKSRMA